MLVSGQVSRQAATMARSRTRLAGWAALFALSATAIAGLGGYGLFQQETYVQEAREKADDYAKHAHAQKEETCVKVAAPVKAQCLQDAQAEYDLKTRDNRREYDDLVAQRKAALWASIMGVAALIGMALSIVGVILVKQTFDETRRTNRIAMRENARATRRAVAGARETEAALAIAERNAGAATKLAETSEKTAERQLRAYLSVKSVTVEQTSHDDDEFILNLLITNNGQTPAMMQKVAFQATWIFDGGSTQLYKYDGSSIYKCHRDTPMNLPWHFKGSFEGSEKDGHIFVAGRLEYKDVFGKLQKDGFGWRTPDSEHGPFYDINLPITLHAFSYQSLLVMMKERKAGEAAAPEGE